MYGLEVDDIVGRNHEDIVPLESQAKVISLKRSALESGEPKDAEISFGGNGAGPRWFNFHIEPLRGPDGVVGLTCAAVNITKRKEGGGATFDC